MSQAADDTLDRGFSLYLDAARGLAALAVVVAHFAYFRILDAAQIARLPDFGREAVIAFFVLSGFVIAYSARHKHRTAADYAAARAARLYAVVLPVLLLSFALAALVHTVAGLPVGDAYELRKPWLYIPFHLAFQGDTWGFAERPPWLVPYWSLDYEAWYYVLFGCWHFLAGRRRWLAVGAVLLLVGPRLWLLLPVWLSGVALYRWQQGHVLGRGVARAGWLATVVLVGLWGWLDPEPWLRGVAQHWWSFSGIRMGSADRVLADYPVALLVWVNFACARHAGFGTLLERAARPIRFLAAHTFTLYLSHALVIGVWQTLLPIERGAVHEIVGIAVAIALAALALNPLTEVLRKRLLRGFEAVLTRAPDWRTP
nr:acyltransferase family protein [uncultured Massilia sp.]